ncbi:MAG: hypothetical protein L0H64_24430, partial [Pseudonocardia sp.]|nr:hypothetical protein [Pseudonocardia sp.]
DGLPGGDGPAGDPDRSFPSAHLELEALGRAHHFLSQEQGLPQEPGSVEVGSGVRVAAAVGAVVDGRIAPPARRAASREGIAPVGEVVRFPVRPGADWCAGFLAGVLDARGGTARGEVRIGHRDEEVVGRVAGALHRLGLRFAVEAGERGERVVRLLGGSGEFVRFLRLTGPAVGRHRDLSGASVEAAEEMRVVSVEHTGHDEAMYGITTGTGDVVAEGVVSHNCSHGAPTPTSTSGRRADTG